MLECFTGCVFAWLRSCMHFVRNKTNICSGYTFLRVNTGARLTRSLERITCVIRGLVLKIASIQWFSIFVVLRSIAATHINPTTPSKTRIKQMQCKCVHKIYTRAPSKNDSQHNHSEDRDSRSQVESRCINIISVFA